jgi:hypothetical protein
VDELKKIYIVLSTGRQITGESIAALSDYYAVKIHKAFTNSEKANEYCSSVKKEWEEKIITPEGPVQCYCTNVGVHVVELEE